MTRKPQAAEVQKTNRKDDKKVKAARKPQSFEPPPVEEIEDIFDQTPFQETPVPAEVYSHSAKQGTRIGWWSILGTATVALLLLVLGYQFQLLIDEFFGIHPYFGWLTVGLVGLIGLSLIALIGREILALFWLRKLGRVRNRAKQTVLENTDGKKIVEEIIAVYQSRPDMKWHIDRLRTYDGEIIDGADRVKIAEKYLMSPLDKEAKQIIATTAKRVSVMTALNPSAVLDILFVGFQILQMLRRIIVLYGGRPGTFGALKLARMVATHLAVTGGLALTDTLIQQFIGKGLAGRLSTKLGEGTVNGIMATRIGLAAIDLCRPLPFMALEQPSLTNFLTDLFTQDE